MIRTLLRRTLTLTLSAGLVAGATAVPAQAAESQEIDFSGVPTTWYPGQVWTPEPVSDGAPPLDLTLVGSPTACVIVPATVASETVESVRFSQVGPCTVSAVSPAYTGYDASPPEEIDFDVAGHATTTSLDAVAPVTVGEDLQLRAVVDSGGQGLPSGAVEFREDSATGALVGTDSTLIDADATSATNSDTVATLAVPTTETGTTSYVAVYLPGSPTQWAASTSGTRAATVAGHSTTATIGTIDTVTLPSPLIVPVTVDSGSHGVPRGTVEVRLASADPSSAPLADATLPPTGGTGNTGSVDVFVPTTDAGTRSYVATYLPTSPTLAGDTSDPAAGTVIGPTTTTLAAIAPVPVGTDLSLTATVDTAGQGVPTGDVAFHVGSAAGTLVGREALSDTDAVTTGDDDATATISVTTTAAGSTSYVAVYEPSTPTSWGPSTSVARTGAVGAPTSTAFEPTPDPAPPIGAATTLRAVVDSGTTTPPVGSIEFVEVVGGVETVVATVSVAAIAASGRAEAEYAVTPADTTSRTYRARFVPTDPATWAASTSGDHVMTPGRRTVEVDIAVPSQPVVRGATPLTTIAITATDAVDGTRVASATTGTLTTVELDGDPVAVTWTDGRAELTVPGTLAAGEHTVSVDFSPADPDRYDDPAAASATFDVTRPTATTLSPSSTTVLPGDSATLTATVTTATAEVPAGDTVPAGTVVLYAAGNPSPVDSAVLPSLAGPGLHTAEVTLTAPTSAAGSTAYTTEFVPADDDDFHPSTSAAVEVAAVKGTLTVVLDVPQDPVATSAHDPVTITVHADHGTPAAPVAADHGATEITYDGTPVPDADITWAGDVASFEVLPSVRGTRSVSVAFVPQQPDRYQTPAATSADLVVKDPQPISAAVDGPHYAASTPGEYVVEVTGARSGVSAVSTTTNVCTVHPSTLAVTLLEAGPCHLDVSAAEDDDNLSGDAGVDLTVAVRPVTISAHWEPSGPAFNDSVDVWATALPLGAGTAIAGTGTITVYRLDAGGTATKVHEDAAYSFSPTPTRIRLPAAETKVATYRVDATFSPDDPTVYDEGTDTRQMVIGKDTETVDFAASTGHLYVGKTWTDVAAGSTSGTAATLEVVTAPGTTATCRVEDGTDLTFLAAGPCTVRATVAESDDYDEAVSDDTTFTAALRPVALAASVRAKDTGDARPRFREPVVVTVTATDGVPDGATPDPVAGTGRVTVTGPTTTTTTDVVLGADGTGTVEIEPTERGTHTVTVQVTATTAVGGVARYAVDPAARATTPPTSFEVTVGRQPISWGTAPASSYLVDGEWTPDVRHVASGNPLVLSASPSSTCTVVDQTTVVMTGAPTSSAACTVTASQVASDDYEAGSLSVSLSVRLRPVTVTVAVPAGSHVYRQPVDITATAYDTDLAANVPDPPRAPGSTGPAPVSGQGTITVDGVAHPVDFEDGVATYRYLPQAAKTGIVVDAEFVPTREHVYAVTQPTATTLDVGRATPGALTPLNPEPAHNNRQDTWQPDAPGLGSTEPVVITTTTPTTCSVAAPPAGDTHGPVVTFNELGTCSITISQAADANWNAATAWTGTVTVERLATRLVAASAPADLTYDTPVSISLSATATRAGTALAGSVSVALTDLTTSVTTTHTTTRTTPGTFTFAVAKNVLQAGEYTGVATFTPDAAGDYQETTTPLAFTVDLAQQTAVLAAGTAAPSSPQSVGTTWTPAFEPTASQKPVELSVDVAASGATEQSAYLPGGELEDPTDPWNPPAASCRVDDQKTLVLVAAGPCHVRAVAPAVARRYAESPAYTASLTVQRIGQELVLSVSPKDTATPPPTVGKPVSVYASATVVAPGNPAATGRGPLTVTDPDGTPVTGAPSATQDWHGGGRYFSFTPTQAGTYSVRGVFRATDRLRYEWDDAVATITVQRGQQTLQPRATQPTRPLVGETWTPDPWAVTEPGTPVSVSAAGTACSVGTTGVVSFDAVGTCQLTLSTAETDDYAATSVPLPAITVEQTQVSIGWSATADPQVGTPYTVVVAATATTGGRPVPGDGTVTLTLAGSTVPEPSVTRSAWVDGAQTITFTPAVAGLLVVDGTFTPRTRSYATPTVVPLERTVSPGAQWVRVSSEPSTETYVEQSWQPAPSGGGGPAAQVEVSAGPASVCDVSSPKSDPTVHYRAPGTCTVVTKVPQEPLAPATPNWVEAARTDVITVRAHPVEVVVSEPAPVSGTTLQFGEPVTLHAKVTGRVNGAGVPGAVPGTVVFTLDGADITSAVTVDPTGAATATVTLREQPAAVQDGVLAYEHRVGARFLPTRADYWAASALPVPAPADATFWLKTQSILVDPSSSTTLQVGQQWTPNATFRERTGSPQVAVAAADAGYCSVTAGTVTALSADADGHTCQVSYSQPTDGVWAAATVVSQPVTVVRHPTSVQVSAAPVVVGDTLALQAEVFNAAVAATPTTSSVPRTVPGGSVVFTVDGTALPPVPVGDTGTATTSYETRRAGALDVSATYTPGPSYAATYAAGTGTATAAVARARTTTSATSVGDGVLSATVERSSQPATAISQAVEFSWSPLTTPRSWTPLGSPDVVNGVATLTGSMPPSDQAVAIRATYLGDDDHAPSDPGPETVRGVPTITGSVVGGASAWHGQAVRVRFDCTWPDASTGTCPDDATLDRDGRNQSVTRTVRATNGGTASVTVGDLNIDTAAPRVRITGPRAGSWYRGAAPAGACAAHDDLSGIASCTVTRRELGGSSYRDVAVALDQAGNRTTEHLDFSIRQDWVVDAPLVRSGFQVRRASEQRIVVRTEGPRPQLMLPPGAKGKLRPAKVFRATKVRNGVITWYVDVKVPRSLGAGSSWKIGYRLAGTPAAVTTLRLDVVRKPAAGDGR